MAVGERSVSEVLRRGYSDEEIQHIYALGRLCLELGDLHRAEAIFTGIAEIAGEFVPALLGLAYLSIQGREYEHAIARVRHVLKLDANCHEAMLYLIACLLTVGDFNSAGTLLGEVGERIESGLLDHPNLIRFYKAQLARYQYRS